MVLEVWGKDTSVGGVLRGYIWRQQSPLTSWLLLSVQMGEVLQEAKGPTAFLPTFMLGTTSEKSLFPGSAPNRRHRLFPEWLIGFYLTGVSRGRNNSSSVAEPCQEGFSAWSSLPSQLILGSVLLSIWETGHGSNPTLCSMTSRHTGETSQEPSQFP